MDLPEARRIATKFVTDTTAAPTPRPAWLRRGSLDLVEVADVVVALGCFAASAAWLSATEHGHGQPPHPGWVLTLAAFVTCAPLVLRTRFPLTAWAAAALAILGTNLLVPGRPAAPSAFALGGLAVYGLCLYAVAVRCRPRIVITAAVVTVGGAAFIHPVSAVPALFLSPIPILLGVIVRTRRSGQRELVEQQRKHSGERALLEERQRIARELHDVVAHHMSVIAIQAEAAPYKIAEPQPELVESFGEIRSTALTGLGELRRLLGVLRTGEADTAPQPGLSQLDALLDSARAGGVSVTATCSGNPERLPEGVDLSAYRIVQEALSNAMRHAPGSHVTVHVAYTANSLAVEIGNDAGRRRAAAAAAANGPPGPPLAGEARARRADGADTGSGTAGAGIQDGGHGIIGMRERAAMLSGTLEAGPTPDGGFQVTAVLPVSSGHAMGAA